MILIIKKIIFRNNKLSKFILKVFNFQKILKLKINYILSADIETNKIINQKYFYTNSEKIKTVSIETRQKIQIKKKENEKLEQYLQEKNIDIKYFKNFKGYINLTRVEFFNKRQKIYIKDIYIYFHNVIVKEKNEKSIIMNIKNELDIDIILILFQYYLKDLNYGDKLHSKFYDFSFFRKLNSNIIINTKFNYACQDYLDYFLKYKELVVYSNTTMLLKEDSLKDFIYLEFENNIHRYELYFENSKETYELYKKNKDFLYKFKGSLFLIEFYIPQNKKILKKYVLVFLNEKDWKWRVFYLADILNLNFVLMILKKPWFENNYLFDEVHKNMMKNFVRTNTSLYENDDEYFKNIESCSFVRIKNKEELIYHIEYYKLFL